MAAVSNRVHRRQAQRLETHRERAQRSLCVHHEIVIPAPLTVQLDDQAPPIFALLFDVPVQDVLPVNIDNFTLPFDVQLEGAHTPLHHPVIKVIDLSRQAGANRDVHR